MKLKLFFIMIFFIAKGPLFAAPLQDSFEPNDTLEQAKPITFETPHIFSLKEKTDQDWFSFEVKEDSYVTINTGGFYNAYRYYAVELFSQDKKNIMSQSQSLPYTKLLSKGKYYFKVTHFAGQSYTHRLTHLFLSAIPNIDFLEPNDQKEEAHPSQLNQTQWLHLFHSADSDYFHFEIPESGYFRVFVDKDYSWKTKYEIISQKTNTNVSITGYEWIRMEPGKYFIKFYRYKEDRVWYKKYSFYLKFLPEIDKEPPHTNQQSARTLTLEKVEPFYVPIISDQNYFKVEIPEEGRYFLMIRPAYKKKGVLETQICPENEHATEEKCETFQTFDQYKNFKKGIYTIHIYRKDRYTSFMDQKFELLLVKAGGAQSPLDFYIIDLEGGNATEALKKVTEAAGGQYVHAKSEKEIKTALQKAAKQKGKGHLWLIVVVILIGMGIGGFYFYKKRYSCNP